MQLNICPCKSFKNLENSITLVKYILIQNIRKGQRASNINALEIQLAGNSSKSKSPHIQHSDYQNIIRDNSWYSLSWGCDQEIAQI